MKFDCVVGNPPYQVDNYPIWKDFGALAMDLAPTVAFVTPRSVLNGAPEDTISTAHSNFYERIRYNLRRIDYSADNHFTVTKRICWWLYDSNYTGTTALVDDNKNEYNFDCKSAPFLLYELTPTAYKVYTKIINMPKMVSWCLATNETKPNGPAVILPKSKHISLAKMRWTNNVAKDPTVDASWIIMYPTDNPNVAEYVHTKIFRYIFNILGGLDGNTYSLLRKMPVIDYDQTNIDHTLYTAFDLTEEEITIVESAKRSGQNKKKR